MIQAVFSPNSRWLTAIEGWDGREPAVHLWDTATWTKASLRGHSDAATAVDFSPDSRWLATGARNGEVHLWPLAEGSGETGPFSEESSGTLVAADGSGFLRTVLRVSSNGVAAVPVVEAWSAVPLKRMITVPADAYWASCLAVLLPGARTAVLGCADGSLHLLGPEPGQERVVTNAHAKPVKLLDASLDGSTLVSQGYFDGLLRFWRLPGLEPIAELTNAMHIHGIKLSDDGKRVAGFSGSGDMGVWEIPSLEGPPMWRAYTPLQSPKACVFSADHRFVAVATQYGELLLWDLSTRKRSVLPRTLTFYSSLAFSPDGSRLAAASDKEAKMFDVATGQEVFAFKQPALQLAFTRDGEKLLAVNNKAAFVLEAPPLARLQFGWLREKPSQEAPPYFGPHLDQPRPNRP
jgi:WD40 repeat protein